MAGEAAAPMGNTKRGLPRYLVLKHDLTLTLRQAGPADAEQLLAFLERVSGESENVTFGPGEFGWRVEDERVFLRQSAQTSTSIYLLAEVAGEIVGTLTFSAGIRPRIQHAGEFGIAVARTHWNLGIGSQLLACLIDWAQQGGTIRKINLRVRVDNLSAIHLYEKFGFVQEGRLSREFFLHGQFVDVYLMGLLLDPT
jgi:RimJ/RimL family protein N-acetyltransferase